MPPVTRRMEVERPYLDMGTGRNDNGTRFA
jgi:hypothetical protein